MRNGARWSAVLVTAMLSASVAQAMEMRQFDRMAPSDRGEYIATLIQGAQKVLIDEGKDDHAAKIDKLFTTARQSDTTPLGMIELQENIARARLVGAEKHAKDPNGTPRLYEVRGARLYVETFGHGPPILFLHGGMNFFDNNFAKQREYFAAYGTVIGIDQRGHGHSPDGPWTLSYKLMADDTAAVIEQLGLSHVDVVGHSDGANVGLLLARDHPELVGRLVISGANLRSGLSADEVQRRSQWSPEQLAEKLRTLADSLPPSFRTDYAKVSPDGPDHWMKLLEKCYQMWIQPVVIEPADLKRISAPVLVMAGDHDFTSIEETVEIYRGLPNGQLIILPATGHGTMRQRPELANLAIREFLEQPVSGTPMH